MKKTGHIINCLRCRKEKYISGWEFKKNRGKYCSRECYQVAERGRSALNIDGLKLGHGWNKGKKVNKLTGLRRDEVENYNGIHHWIARKLGRPMECRACGIKNAKKYEWANKSQFYKRDINDWIRVCVKCHRQFDLQFRPEGRIIYA